MKSQTQKLRSLVVLMVLFTISQVHAQNVTATVTKLSSAEGTLMIELVDKAGKTIDQKAISVTGKECEVKFENVTVGTYAIRYFHDENNNGKMDTGTFGIPKEGYGFSNNARGFMGPPDFEDMLFEVSGNVEMTLKTVN